MSQGKANHERPKGDGIDTLLASERRPKPGEVLERLNTAFMSGYLTLISIIQGVVLGYLATQVDGHFRQFSVADWIFTLNTLSFVILVWNEYLMGVLAFIWIPTLLDAVIPFAFFVAELFSAHSTYGSLVTWALSTSAIAFIALAAFANQFIRAGNAPYHNRDVLTALGWHRSLAMLFCGISSVMFLTSGLLARYQGSTLVGIHIPFIVDLQNVRLPFSIFAAGLIWLFALRSVLYWNRIRRYAAVDAEV